MKKRLIRISTILALLACCALTAPGKLKDQQERKQRSDTIPDGKANLQLSSIHPANLLTLPDAEKILGEKAHLTDSSSTIKMDTLEYKCTYKANSRDPKNGKTGVIYFLYEQYAKVSIAKKVYSAIKTGNQNHEGFKVIPGLGDEAYFHSDGENFYFILVRKAEKMIRMKVNKITSTSSINDFNLIAKNIAAAL